MRAIKGTSGSPSRWIKRPSGSPSLGTGIGGREISGPMAAPSVSTIAEIEITAMHRGVLARLERSAGSTIITGSAAGRVHYRPVLEQLGRFGSSLEISGG